MNIFFKRILLLSIITILSGCNKNNIVPENKPFIFAKGADISWITEMEASGIKFKNYDGQEMECTSLMKELGLNAIRLRVWVNPTNGWCGKEDFMIKARRAKALGMDIMVDFHYSDWWADPGKQNKPKNWIDYSFEELKSAVSNHTKDILTSLKNEGISPKWVQVGNETSNGMLWEDGKASKNMNNYTQLHNAGYYAVKSIFPKTKVIVLIDNGFDSSKSKWLLDGLKSNNGKWDIVGLSLYPNKNNWEALSVRTLENMQTIISGYGSDVMLCEVGMGWTLEDECYLFLKKVLSFSKTIQNNKYIGVFYWEPECSNKWNGYYKGAFNEHNMPTKAMKAFNTL